jgi:acylphosphatase
MKTPAKMKKRLNLIITGRVQRVGYRFQAMEKAYKFRITGYIINRDDESVYIEAEGEEEDLDRYLDWCRSGPLGCRVDNIKSEEGEIKGYSTFEIRSRSRSVNPS